MDPTVRAAGIAGAVAFAAAFVGFLVSRRSVAVVELEASLKRLVAENVDLRLQLAEVRVELLSAERRIDELESKGRAP